MVLTLYLKKNKQMTKLSYSEVYIISIVLYSDCERKLAAVTVLRLLQSQKN